MSNPDGTTTNNPPQDPPTPPVDDDKQKDAKLKIELDGFDKLDTKIQEQFAGIIGGLSKEITSLKEQLKTVMKSSEEESKKTILANMEKAGFDPKNFESLDLDPLKAVQLALATQSKDIVIPDPDKKPKDVDGTPVTVWDSKEKKRVPWKG